MKFKYLNLFSLLVLINTASAQSDLIFNAGFEFISKLNDTGITWTGEYPSGNNAECISAITSLQDCNTGRDVTHNDDSDGHAGFSFTKLDDTGEPLFDQSVDYATTPWSCVRDNVTGLVWEVKTTTAGIHNKDNTYKWGGDTAIGKDHPDAQGIYYDPSWNELVRGSNTDSLCGFNNWRVPKVAELLSILNRGTLDPAIDADYFPNTTSNWFWSSSPFTFDPSVAWIVGFYYGYDFDDDRESSNRIRLVRSYGE